jgi:hypothetical protein
MKYYNLAFGKVMEDDNRDADMVAQVWNEVLAVVAPSNMAISCTVYMVPFYDDGEELTAYKVFSHIKCVDPESSISSQLRAHLEMVLKERSLCSTFGVGNLSEISREEFDELSRNHRHCQA